jgi:hypothetical protein
LVSCWKHAQLDMIDKSWSKMILCSICWIHIWKKSFRAMWVVLIRIRLLKPERGGTHL